MNDPEAQKKSLVDDPLEELACMEAKEMVSALTGGHLLLAFSGSWIVSILWATIWAQAYFHYAVWGQWLCLGNGIVASLMLWFVARKGIRELWPQSLLISLLAFHWGEYLNGAQLYAYAEKVGGKDISLFNVDHFFHFLSYRWMGMRELLHVLLSLLGGMLTFVLPNGHLEGMETFQSAPKENRNHIPSRRPR